jgi:protoheme IX farnesyltransferase
MFAIVFLWTPPHFRALAISYTNDYATAGVPMLPVTHGAIEARRRSFVYAVVTVATSLALYLTGDVGLIYLVVAGLSGGYFVWLAIRQIREATNRAAVSLFRYSTSYLGFIFVAMVADRLIPL